MFLWIEVAQSGRLVLTAEVLIWRDWCTGEADEVLRQKGEWKGQIRP